jgi:hypothetical protein
VRVAVHVHQLARELKHELKRRGFTVIRCHATATECPVLRGNRCAAAERADVLIFNGSDELGQHSQLVRAMRARYPDLPIVVTGRAVEPGLIEALGEPWIVTLVGSLTADRVRLRIDEALGGTPEAMLGIVG